MTHPENPSADNLQRVSEREKAMMKPNTDSRHLHFAGDSYTLCGCRRRVPVRAGSRVYWEQGHPSVHVTKARKTDCPECRKLFRGSLRQQREDVKRWAAQAEANRAIAEAEANS
jgi:hypothetical protein